jgi:hypothetical protein
MFLVLCVCGWMGRFGATTLAAALEGGSFFQSATAGILVAPIRRFGGAIVSFL